MATGAVFIAIGLVRVTSSLTLAEMIAYIVSGGIGGLALLGSGVVLRASAQLHEEWDRIDRVEAALRGQRRREGLI
jgi:hypothetical protein